MLRFTKIWFFLLLLAQGLSAQDFYLQDSSYNKYRLPSIVIGPAFTSYKGDYNSKDIFFNANFNKGLSVACEYRVKDFLGVSLTGVFSKLTQNEKDIPSRNFRTNLLEISARGIFYLDNNITMKRGMGLSTFLFVGAGIMSHNAMGDLKDSQGRSYFYWKDGTVRDQAYDPENPLGGTIIQRDYEYETVLDTSNSVSNMSMVIPVGLGLKFKVSDRIETNVMLSYQFTGTDYLDFYHPEQDKGIFKGNDGYWNCMITIQYNLGGKAFMSDEDVHYQNVDFAVLETDNDEDGDGVEDIKDKCAGTPQGVAVDSKGCPPDSDNDGIPDYEDKEPNSVAGAG
ncbi:MAG: hypothetical protein KKA07_12195 [Bacteroidetes bacterium]|nr:hypothetical protein [Bacteroidota bacterium]